MLISRVPYRYQFLLYGTAPAGIVSPSVRRAALYYIIFFLFILLYALIFNCKFNFTILRYKILISFAHYKFINACKAITMSLKITRNVVIMHKNFLQY